VVPKQSANVGAKSDEKKLSPKNWKICHFSKSGRQIFTIFWHTIGGITQVLWVSMTNIYREDSSYRPDKKIHFMWLAQIVTSEEGET